MNNVEVQKLLDDCAAELLQVKTSIDRLGVASNEVPFLTKYAVIRACGTIEQAFKSIICDFCSKRCKKQVKRFLEYSVRESSMNPRYEIICKLLKNFDPVWHATFTEAVKDSPQKNIWMTSLTSLVDARNDFAHGGNPSASIGDVISYFDNSRAVIQVLDDKVV